MAGNTIYYAQMTVESVFEPLTSCTYIFLCCKRIKIELWNAIYYRT